MGQQLEILLGERVFTDMVKTIYRDQKAKILINGELSESL